MRRRAVLAALGLVLAAAVLQVTLFADVRPLGVAPELPLLMVVVLSQFLRTEPATLVGFLAGLLTDLQGDSLLGSWALVSTVVAFLGTRLATRAEGNPLLLGGGVFALTVIGDLLFLVVGTLFGQHELAGQHLLRTLVLAATYNVVLAIGLIPLTAKAIGFRIQEGWR